MHSWSKSLGNAVSLCVFHLIQIVIACDGDNAIVCVNSTLRTVLLFVTAVELHLLDASVAVTKSQCYKTFYGRNLLMPNMLSMLVPGKPFQPSQMFAVKVVAYLSEVPTGRFHPACKH
jgi:hypothetical protein